MVLKSLVTVVLASIHVGFSPMPSDTDLRAAFCLGALKDVQPIPLESFPEQFKDDVGRLNNQVAVSRERLQAYLLPKLEYLDPAALAVAAEQGRRAAQRAEAQAGQCLNKPNGEITECMRDNLQVSDCREAKFLPF